MHAPPTRAHAHSQRSSFFALGNRQTAEITLLIRFLFKV